MKRSILVLLLLVGACSTSQIQTGQKSLIAVCNGYGLSLSTLADFRAQKKLSDQVVTIVDQIDSVTGPLCDPTKALPTDAGTAYDLVSASAGQLASLVLSVKGAN